MSTLPPKIVSCGGVDAPKIGSRYCGWPPKDVSENGSSEPTGWPESASRGDRRSATIWRPSWTSRPPAEGCGRRREESVSASLAGEVSSRRKYVRASCVRRPEPKSPRARPDLVRPENSRHLRDLAENARSARRFTAARHRDEQRRRKQSTLRSASHGHLASSPYRCLLAAYVVLPECEPETASPSYEWQTEQAPPSGAAASRHVRSPPRRRGTPCRPTGPAPCSAGRKALLAGGGSRCVARSAATYRIGRDQLASVDGHARISEVAGNRTSGRRDA